MQHEEHAQVQARRALHRQPVESRPHNRRLSHHDLLHMQRWWRKQWALNPPSRELCTPPVPTFCMKTPRGLPVLCVALLRLFRRHGRPMRLVAPQACRARVLQMHDQASTCVELLPARLAQSTSRVPAGNMPLPVTQPSVPAPGRSRGSSKAALVADILLQLRLGHAPQR